MSFGLAFLCDRRTANAFALLIIAVFFMLSLVRSYPYSDFKSIAATTGDDWNTYARNALGIKNGDILMRSTKAPYGAPAGFLYSYFIAICLALFGERCLPIFAAQHIMLGLSIALVYWTFRDKMSPLIAAVFLVTLFFFGIKDIYKNYSPLLLSENLALFTMSAFFFCMVKGFEKDNFILQLAAAVFAGLSLLTRPNIAIFAVTLVPLAASYYLKRGRTGLLRLTVFITVLFVSSSLLLVRNYAVCRKPYLLPIAGASFNSMKNSHLIPKSVDLSRADSNILYTRLHVNKDIVGYVEYAAQRPAEFFGFYFKKVLFCLGYLPALTAAYALRTRWVVMWIGYFIYLFLRFRERKDFEIWEKAANLYIFLYYGSLIMLTSVHNYGFRMLIPAINFVLAFAFMGLDRLLPKEIRSLLTGKER